MILWCHLIDNLESFPLMQKLFPYLYYSQSYTNSSRRYLQCRKKMILRKRALKVSQVSKHINIINIHCRKLKFGMLIEHSVWHTVVKVHKNNYVSFCYRIFGNTTVKTIAEIILKCDCQHTKLMCFIGNAMILICYYQHT